MRLLRVTIPTMLQSCMTLDVLLSLISDVGLLASGEKEQRGESAFDARAPVNGKSQDAFISLFLKPSKFYL